jgi:hypothetical protein
VKLEGCWPR